MPRDLQAIAQRRADGDEWQTIAQDLGTSAEALRKRYRRGLAELLGSSNSQAG